jgi:hypothetical protein
MDVWENIMDPNLLYCDAAVQAEGATFNEAYGKLVGTVGEFVFASSLKLAIPTLSHLCYSVGQTRAAKQPGRHHKLT